MDSAMELIQRGIQGAWKQKSCHTGDVLIRDWLVSIIVIHSKL